MPHLSARNVYAQSDGEEGEEQSGDVDNQQLTAAVGRGDAVVGSRVDPIVKGAHRSNL